MAKQMKGSGMGMKKPMPAKKMMKMQKQMMGGGKGGKMSRKGK
jgi:hypothetical protein